MKPYQRRIMAICIFAFAFILLFEARGQRLVSWDAPNAPPSTQEYWEHVLAAAIIVAMGATLTVGLSRASTHEPYTRWELAAYALGIGILIGTAIVSWTSVREYSAQIDPRAAPPLFARHSAA
jgi:hypothetical protein